MYLAHYTKRFIPEFDAECRINSAYFSQRRAELRREAEDNDTSFALAVPQSVTAQQTLQLRLGQTELVLPLSVSPRWVAQLVKELSA